MGKTVIKMILKLIQLIIGDVITAIISISIILCSVDCSESNSRLSYIVSRWNFFPLFLYLVEKITDRFTTLLPKTTISQLELGLLVNKWDLFVLRHPHSQSMNCKFRCVKRIEVLLFSLDRMIVHRRLPHSISPPLRQHFVSLTGHGYPFILLGGWLEALLEEGCLVQEHTQWNG